MIKSLIDSIKLNRARLGIREYKSSFMDVPIYGLDCETVEGKPYSLQLFHKKERCFQKIKDWDEFKILDFLFNKLKKDEHVFAFSHNLKYDLGVLFPNICESKESRFRRKGFNFLCIYPNPAFLKVWKLTGNKHKSQKCITFIDTFKFFPVSLETAGKIAKAPPKLPKPLYLGHREPTERELRYFKDYGIRDAEVCYHLGEEIVSLHKQFDVSLNFTVTPASLSSKIYRKRFLEEEIPYPPKEVAEMGLKSYWGARTEAFCAGTCKARYYDFNSMYSFAMSQIPIPLFNPGWHKTKQLESEHGFYCISGYMPKQKVSPLIVKTQRLTFPCGHYKNITVTGYEAKLIKQYSTDFKVEYGWVYKGRTSYSLKGFIKYFYKLKSSAKNPIEYYFYKLLLNSIYGKWIQLNPEHNGSARVMCFNLVTDKDGKSNPRHEVSYPDKRKIASGLFNPAIASLITGFVRAYLFKLLKKYEQYVLYCDTDSIMVKEEAPEIPVSISLGGLKKEYEGKVTIVHEKLYYIWDKPKKSGLHGFWGNEKQLKELLLSSNEKYNIKHMIQLREAKVQKKQAFKEELQERTINLVTSRKREAPRRMDLVNGFSWLEPCKLR